MPFLNRIRSQQFVICTKRILQEFESNDQIAAIALNKFKILNPITIDEGTYGCVYISQNFIYKTIKFPDKKTEYYKIRQILHNSRQFFDREQIIHRHICQQDDTISCQIFDPLLFGPLIIIKLSYLEGYQTLMQIRKKIGDSDYIQLIDNINIQLYMKAKRVAALDVFHGDYKSNNIMVKITNNSKMDVDIRIIDFGKAQFFSEMKIKCYECFKQYKEAFQQKSIFAQMNLLNQRKFQVFQNFYYSSILQYVFNEYEHEYYYRLFKQIDFHSIALLMVHVYHKQYINDFDKANCIVQKRQQMLCQFIKLFGTQLLSQVLELADQTRCNSIQQFRNNSKLVSDNSSSYSTLSSLSSDKESDCYQMIQFEDVQLKTEKVQVSQVLQKAFKLENNKIYITQYMIDQIQNEKNKEQYNQFEYYLNNVKNEIIKKMILELNSYEIAELVQNSD